jgi:hypothetical protein
MPVLQEIIEASAERLVQAKEKCKQNKPAWMAS